MLPIVARVTPAMAARSARLSGPWSHSTPRTSDRLTSPIRLGDKSAPLNAGDVARTRDGMVSGLRLAAVKM